MTLKCLPYIVDSSSLPAKLPTVAEILSSEDILCDQGSRKVVGVGQHFVVKYGSQIDVMEAENMLFIQQTTSIPVPRVYAIF